MTPAAELNIDPVRGDLMLSGVCDTQDMLGALSLFADTNPPAGGRSSGSLVNFGQIDNWGPDAAFKEDGNPSIAERINSKLIAAQMVLFRPAAGARTGSTIKVRVT
jgi:hypothetical protein